MSLIGLIKEDWNANVNNRKGQIVALFFRIANYSYYSPNKLVKLVGFPIRKFYANIFPWFIAIEIPYQTVIGSRLQIWHGFALVINPAAVIGTNVLLRHCTTIGNKGLNTPCPIIGDNVQIGAHCVLIGDIVIGDNVIIGAGTVVTRSIPKNSIAYGNPMIIKARES